MFSIFGPLGLNLANKGRRKPWLQLQTLAGEGIVVSAPQSQRLLAIAATTSFAVTEVTSKF